MSRKVILSWIEAKNHITVTTTEGGPIALEKEKREYCYGIAEVDLMSSFMRLVTWYKQWSMGITFN
jgi:hypothetical protein